MHEMHLVKEVFADIIKHARNHGATKVSKVYLRMGEFSEINEEIVKFFFKQQSCGTVLEGAEISVEKSPTRELRLLSFDVE